MLEILSTTLNGSAKMKLTDVLILLVFPYIITIVTLLQKPVNRRLDRLEMKFDNFIFGGFAKWQRQDEKRNTEKSERHTVKNENSG